MLLRGLIGAGGPTVKMTRGATAISGSGSVSCSPERVPSASRRQPAQSVPGRDGLAHRGERPRLPLGALQAHALRGRAARADGGPIPYEIVRGVDLRPLDLVPPPFTILTSMFLHGGWAHLVGNMWFLWLFGDNVEEALGPFRYLLFYFVVGIVGAMAQILAMPNSRVPMIGASGAIAGALGAYVMLYPRTRIQTLIMIPLLWPVIQVRAWVFLGLWFFMQ